MLQRLLEIFLPTGRGLQAESREFIAGLANAKIWVLVIGLRGAPSVSGSLSDPTVIDILAANYKDLADLGDDDSVFPFNFERDGTQVLPFFSTKEQSQEFMAGFDGGTGPFQPYELMAGFLAMPQNDDFALVLDAGSPAEREIGHAERRLLRRLARPQGE